MKADHFYDCARGEASSRPRVAAKGAGARLLGLLPCLCLPFRGGGGHPGTLCSSGGGDAEAVIAAFGRIPPTVRPPSSRLRSSQGCSRAKRAALQVEAGRQAGRGGRRDGGRGREGAAWTASLEITSQPPQREAERKGGGGGKRRPPGRGWHHCLLWGREGGNQKQPKSRASPPPPSSRLQSGESLSFPLKRLTREQQAARHYGGDYDDAP